jgi:hypothetical protein
MNGILLDYKDGFLPAIKFLGDWVPTTVVRYRAIDNSYGWVPYLVSNPQVIVMVGFLVTFAMIRLIIKHFSDLDPIGVLASANPEMPDSETPMLKVSQSRDSKPKKSKPKQRAKPRNKSKYWSTKYWLGEIYASVRKSVTDPELISSLERAILRRVIFRITTTNFFYLLMEMKNLEMPQVRIKFLSECIKIVQNRIGQTSSNPRIMFPDHSWLIRECGNRSSYARTDPIPTLAEQAPLFETLQLTKYLTYCHM